MQISVTVSILDFNPTEKGEIGSAKDNVRLITELLVYFFEFIRLFLVCCIWSRVFLIKRMSKLFSLHDVQLLLALVRASRPENSTVDRHIALNDAHQLNKVFTIVGKVGNEDTLIRIFCTRSAQQLTATLNYYHQHYGHDFEQVWLVCFVVCLTVFLVY